MIRMKRRFLGEMPKLQRKMGRSIMHTYEHLFSPLRIRSMQLKNRVVMSPMGSNFAKSSGEMSQEHIEYYRLRAAGRRGPHHYGECLCGLSQGCKRHNATPARSGLLHAAFVCIQRGNAPIWLLHRRADQPCGLHSGACTHRCCTGFRLCAAAGRRLLHRGAEPGRNSADRGAVRKSCAAGKNGRL